MAANQQPAPEPHEYVGEIPCLECGKLLWRISPTHLRKHGLNCKQYLAKYPGAPFQAIAEVAIRVGERVSTITKLIEQGKPLGPKDRIFDVTVIEEYFAEFGKPKIPCLECGKQFVVITEGRC
jgi:hypothetical protein